MANLFLLLLTIYLNSLSSWHLSSAEQCPVLVWAHSANIIFSLSWLFVSYGSPSSTPKRIHVPSWELNISHSLSENLLQWIPKALWIWMTSVQFTFVLGSRNTVFSALERYQDAFSTSAAEQVLSVWTCLALSAQCQALPWWSLEITFMYGQCNKPLDTIGLCWEQCK